MAEPVPLKSKRDRDNKVIPNCWVTDAGYTVAKFRVDQDVTFAITRPCESAPCLRTPDRDEVAKLIEVDMAPLGVAND